MSSGLWERRREWVFWGKACCGRRLRAGGSGARPRRGNRISVSKPSSLRWEATWSSDENVQPCKGGRLSTGREGKEAMGLRPEGLKDGGAVLREQSEVGEGPAQGLAHECLCCCYYCKKAPEDWQILEGLEEKQIWFGTASPDALLFVGLITFIVQCNSLYWLASYMFKEWGFCPQGTCSISH